MCTFMSWKSFTRTAIRRPGYSSGCAMNILYNLGGNHLHLLGFSFLIYKEQYNSQRIPKCPGRQPGIRSNDHKSSPSSNILLSKMTPPIGKAEKESEMKGQLSMVFKQFN